MAARWVVVDDADSAIQYTGPWFQITGQIDGLGNFGPPFQGTSHGVIEDASLSYTFTGELDRIATVFAGIKLASAQVPQSQL